MADENSFFNLVQTAVALFKMRNVLTSVKDEKCDEQLRTEDRGRDPDDGCGDYETRGTRTGSLCQKMMYDRSLHCKSALHPGISALFYVVTHEAC